MPLYVQCMSIAYSFQAASQFVTTYSPCKGIQDGLGFWIPRRGFWISRWQISVFVGGTWIQIAIVGGIPNSLICIPDSKAQDMGFHKKIFPRFQIQKAKLSWIPESGIPYIRRPLACSRRSHHVECGPRSESGKQ